MFKVYEFQWKALNRFQQPQKGKALAQSAEELTQRLLKKGYSQIRLMRNFTLTSTPKNTHITQLIHQLSLLMEASVPLKQALHMLLETCQQVKLYLWLLHLIQQLESGYSFSQGLKKLPPYLSVQEIQLIEMGEKSGQLSHILKNMAQARIKSEKLTQKIKKILFYPFLILSISISVSLLLLIFIVPRFADLYQQKDKSLPVITQILFTLSNFIIENRFVLLSLCFLLFLFFIHLSKNSQIIARLKLSLLNRLPLFHSIIDQARIIFFCQNCALMLSAHIRLDMILNSFLSAQNPDVKLHNEIEMSLQQLKQGYRFSESLNGGLFPSDVIQMITIGEQSGKLAYMLEYISEYYQQKLDYQIDLLSQLLEPLLMLVMGIIIGVIMLGLYLPIFDLGGMIE